MDNDPLPVLKGPLQVLPPADLALLMRQGRWVSVDRDEVVVRQGDRSDHVLVIAQGRFGCIISTPTGRSLLVAVRGPGDVVGELAAIDGQPRSATVSALEPGRVLRLPGAHLREMARTRPELTWALLRATIRRLRETDRRMVDVAIESTATRLARTLLELAATHGRLNGDGFVLELPLSQEELASTVGASREGVSRALGQLRRSGLLTTGRMAVTVVDVDGLRQVALGG